MTKPRVEIDQSTTENGFETGDVPFISEQQLNWLAHRLGSEDDAEPCQIMQIDPDVVKAWKRQKDFRVVYQRCVTNKREGFKYLSTQLLPKGLRVLSQLLDEPSVAARTQALTLLLRTNGLLVDKVHRVDASAVAKLMESLRTHTVIEVEPQPLRLLPGAVNDSHAD